MALGRADADRNHRHQLEIAGRVPQRTQVLAKRAGDDGEDDVVDGPAVGVLDPAERRQIAAHPGEAAVGSDLGVER